MGRRLVRDVGGNSHTPFASTVLLPDSSWFCSCHRWAWYSIALTGLVPRLPEPHVPELCMAALPQDGCAPYVDSAGPCITIEVTGHLLSWTSLDLDAEETLVLSTGMVVPGLVPRLD